MVSGRLESGEKRGLLPLLASDAYFVSYRFPTSFQLTTFHHALT
jgi:hypothetical protein